MAEFLIARIDGPHTLHYVDATPAPCTERRVKSSLCVGRASRPGRIGVPRVIASALVVGSELALVHWLATALAAAA